MQKKGSLYLISLVSIICEKVCKKPTVNSHNISINQLGLQS